MGWCNVCCTWFNDSIRAPLAKIAAGVAIAWCLDYLEIRIS